jgi:hypothetical protein
MDIEPKHMDVVTALNVLTGLGFARDPSTQEIYCTGEENIKKNPVLFELARSEEVDFCSNTTDGRYTLKCTPAGEKEIIALARMISALSILEPDVKWRFHSFASKIWGGSQKSGSEAYTVVKLLTPLKVRMEGTENPTFKIDAFTASDLQAIEAKAADKTKSAICSGCGGCSNCKPTHAAVPVVSAVEPDLRGLKSGDQITIPFPRQGGHFL